MISDEAAKMAAQCRHYAMCKIDFLGTGICGSGVEKGYVAYYPQGRMDIYAGLAKGAIPVTEALVNIAETCTLCGICDKQCHFVTGMRPVKVMRALKEYIRERLKGGQAVERPAPDETLLLLRAIVGDAWATNDPAILAAYSNDPFPLAGPQMPRWVVLPARTDECAEIVKLALTRQLPYAVRGNGGSVFGFVFSNGIIIDTIRMKGIIIDRDNWTVSVQAGVTSFEVQEAVYREGFRVNTAEPAATACGNIVCTGTFSSWSNVYGTAADNFVTARFVGHSGDVFDLNDKGAPNLYSFRHDVLGPPGICTEALLRLHPRTDDETAVFLPFSDFEEAVSLARQLSMRRIGLAIAVIGNHYLSAFISPTEPLAKRVRGVFEEVLGVEYALYVAGDRYTMDAIRTFDLPCMDASLVRTVMLGLPKLVDEDLVDLVGALEGKKRPFELFCRKEVRPILEAVFSPSPENIASSVEEDLREFYRGLYATPEMSDPLWLNTFRIVTSRMSRRKHMFAFLVYVPLDRIAVINDVIMSLKKIADKHGIDNDYGFLTPLDLGKRAILEYDYYIDHTDEREKEKVAQAMAEIEPLLDGLEVKAKGVKWLKYIFAQGCARKEQFLYL